MRLPSEEKPWLKWYQKDAMRVSAEPLEAISMWECIRRRFEEHGDTYPAFSYFGRQTSRSEVIARVEIWARTFRGMGVRPDDRVVVFSPFTPTLSCILFALNHIGAWPVLLNIAASREALSHGSRDAEIAVVADAVEQRIAHVLRDAGTFRHVIFIRLSDDMPYLAKAAYRMKYGRASRRVVRSNPAYIPAAEAVRRWSSFSGKTEAAYREDRPALITSSGGTSEAGFSKQIMDSNRAVIAMITQSCQTPIIDRYQPGGICYTSLPPFVSTAIYVLFFVPLYRNMTCVLDPQSGTKAFTRNTLRYRPSVTLLPGRGWMDFFTTVESMLRKGRKPDLSRFTMPVIGGEGVFPENVRWMNSLLRKCGSPTGMTVGYGMSELFSMLTVDCRTGYESDNDRSPVMTVGTPMPGAVVGIFDEEGHELSYGQRGEIRTRSTTMMLGYYNDEALTSEVVSDGWFRTGDYGSIDEDGRLYVYCRLSDGIVMQDGSVFYPVDIELLFLQIEGVREAMIVNMAQKGEPPLLAAHIAVSDSVTDTNEIIRRSDALVTSHFPRHITIAGYKIHRGMFRMNSVCKIDRQSYRQETEGYCRPVEDGMDCVSFNTLTSE